MQAHKGASVQLQKSFLKSALQETSASCNCCSTEFPIAVGRVIPGDMFLDGEFLLRMEPCHAL